MSAGRRYFESPLDTLLTFDIAEIQIEMGIFSVVINTGRKRLRPAVTTE